jgi:RNA polymerase-binding transcription factor DksA
VLFAKDESAGRAMRAVAVCQTSAVGPIPQARLEAIPETICTIEEEQAFEINSWN